MTISPPTKVKLDPGEPARVLASGIDSLAFTFDVNWPDTAMFDRLANEKTQAGHHDGVFAGCLALGEAWSDWHYNLLDHGAGGYEWCLVSKDVSMKIGNWQEVMSRPSVIAEIRSEALWANGAASMLEMVKLILQTMGGEIACTRVSRCDLCVDLLLPLDDWHDGLVDLLVTRAQDISTYQHNKQMTGIQIGKGQMMARLYDKVAEIRRKSHKFWMFGVWDIKDVPDDCRVIRVEFQLRRDTLKRLCVGDFGCLIDSLDRVWAYCSRSWLKVQTGTGPHHTQRKNLPWWDVVQGGFAGALDAEPLVRLDARTGDVNRLLSAIHGYVSSYAATTLDGTVYDEDRPLAIRDYMSIITEHLLASHFDDETFTAKVHEKLAKFSRMRRKLQP